MSDYGYLNARVCSMRTGLLTPETLEELLTLDDVRTVAERLLDTAYRTGLADAMAQHEPLTALDRALDGCLQETVQRVLKIGGDEGRDWIRIFVSDWDIQALKTVLRGVRRHLGRCGLGDRGRFGPSIVRGGNGHGVGMSLGQL